MQEKNKIRIEIIIGLIVAIAVSIGWSAWFGTKNPQTGFQRIASIVGGGKLKPGVTPEIMFLGDSITAREDWNVLFKSSNIMNAGISGNTTDDVIARLDSVLQAKPKKIFLMIGINDLLRGKNILYILANYGTILNKIKLDSPGALVYIQSVLPINNDISTQGTVDGQKIIALNNQLKALADKNGEIFIELYPYFCGADAKLYLKYTNDGLHPNAYGYMLWKDLIGQYLK
ncbi:MAG: GDSL-type esterase/lipase family protein [Candidatus Moranbacteria bacterium]|nr:GDSL-type esterase/lipase family protein [Candidatus Moranbacteria bacterium]